MLPPLEPGRYVVELDCVSHQVSWFSKVGSQTAKVEVDVKGEE
jgi:hypothetical protein